MNVDNIYIDEIRDWNDEPFHWCYNAELNCIKLLSRGEYWREFIACNSFSDLDTFDIKWVKIGFTANDFEEVPKLIQILYGVNCENP